MIEGKRKEKMRGKKIVKKIITPDPVYNSRIVHRVINKTMKDGKKTIARRHVYKALEEAGRVKKTDKPEKLLEEAIGKIAPNMEVRPRRVGGASYQVPMPVRGERRINLALGWLVEEARRRPNKEYHEFWQKLAAEILEAAEGQGRAVERKNQMHKMAEANKAFAHFRW